MIDILTILNFQLEEKMFDKYQVCPEAKKLDRLGPFISNPIKIQMLSLSSKEKEELLREIEEQKNHINSCNTCRGIMARQDKEMQEMWEEPCPMRQKVKKNLDFIKNPRRLDLIDFSEEEKNQAEKEINEVKEHLLICAKCQKI
ncbi:MAG: hypothetical protein HYV52_01120 [Parcubacteria group bacterium]|nr:hypothetical protein [Parcubacteria group bacterium]